MSIESMIDHGKKFSDGTKVYEFPIYKIVNLGIGRWNVLCDLYGDSGYRDTKAKCEQWVDRHIRQYVLASEYNKLQNKLARLEKRIKELGYGSIEEFDIDHTGD